MSVWILFVIGLNFGLIAAVAVLWVKVSRPQKDDPRLSKGLQLLQSKIAILEDLSDRSETQVNQLLKMMDQKIKEVKGLMDRSDEKLTEIDRSMQRSLEVAEIFEDKIPHEEIIDRQNTRKYLQAAQLAHQGKSINEIAQAVDLSVGEIEIITKLNRDQMLIAQDQVPAWARIGQDHDETYQPVQTRTDATEKLKKEFEQACRDHDAKQQELEKKFEKFGQFEPNKFRQQVQSFVDNIMGDPDKKALPDSQGVDWVNESSAPADEPVASETLAQAPETTDFVETSAEPEATVAAPASEMARAVESVLTDQPQPPSAESEMTAELLQKAAQKAGPSEKFIRAEESDGIQKVKFPRIDL